MRGGAGGEHEVAIGADVVGTLALPAGPGLNAGVLMLHGFGGNRDEHGGLFATLAQRLLEKRIASLRIDLPGARQQRQVFDGRTFPRHRDAASAAFDWLANRDGIDRDRIGLLGFSFGGALAIACLSERVQPRCLALLGTVMRPADDLAGSLGPDAMGRIAREGAVELDWGDRRIVVERSFLASLAVLKLFENLARYRGAVLALAGARDRHAKYVDEIESAASESEGVVPVVLGNADHFFNAGTAGDPVTGAALRLTADVLDTMLAGD